MEKRKTSVRLMGRDYALVTDRTEEEVQRIARYADRKMRELAILSHAPDGAVAVLTCVTLAEELLNAQEENLRLMRQLAALAPAADARGEQTSLAGRE